MHGSLEYRIQFFYDIVQEELQYLQDQENSDEELERAIEIYSSLAGMYKGIFHDIVLTEEGKK